MFNKIDNLSPQARILIAVILALLFFVPYSYLYKPTQTTEQENKTTNSPIPQTVSLY